MPESGRLKAARTLGRVSWCVQVDGQLVGLEPVYQLSLLVSSGLCLRCLQLLCGSICYLVPAESSCWGETVRSIVRPLCAGTGRTGSLVCVVIATPADYLPSLLAVPSSRTKSYGDRAFCVTAPKPWNSLPYGLKRSPTFTVFRKSLKTHLFTC